MLLPNLHDTFFARCAHTINEVSRLLGYSIDIAATDQDPLIELDEASRMLRRGVDGLIVIPSGLEKTSALLNREFERIPIVAMDRPVKGPGNRFDTLVVENRKGAQLGTQHLISSGHRKIAYFTLQAPLYTLRLRIAGYVSAMKAAGLEPLVVEVPETIPDTTARLKEILQSYKPTAVFAGNNVVSSQLLHSLYELSLHPPEKMAFVGFDDFEFASLLGSGITVISQPVELMARRAAELLFSKLGNTAQEKSIGQTIILPVRLIVRGSSGSGREPRRQRLRRGRLEAIWPSLRRKVWRAWIRPQPCVMRREPGKPAVTQNRLLRVSRYMLPVREEGSRGPWIVLLHWLGGSAHTWRDVSALLSRRGYRVAALDLPGFGDAASSADYGIAAMADAVVETVRSLRGRHDRSDDPYAPWLLGGHSLGGKVAAAVAGRAVDRDAGLANLQGLLLVSASPPTPEPMPGGKREQLLESLGVSTGSETLDRERAGRFVKDNVGKLPLPPERERLAQDDLLRMNRAAFRHWLTDGSREDWGARIGVLPLPALILAGSEDAVLGPEAQTRLVLPHVRSGEVVTSHGAGHLGPMERPGEVALRFADFAERVGVQGAPSASALTRKFETLLEGPLTSPQTRTALRGRLHAQDESHSPQSFGREEWLMLRALADAVVPGAPCDLATRVDQTLTAGAGDGWRPAALPEDREAWRKGLRSLEQAAYREHDVPFVALTAAQQEQLLERARSGALGKGAWGSLGLGASADVYTAAEMTLWFDEARGLLAKLYMSDPRTMERVGFTGFADEAGFTQLRLGQLEEFER